MTVHAVDRAAVLRQIQPRPPRPTRVPAAFEYDLPPCHNTWGWAQLACAHEGTRPGAHECWTWSGWPHICRCTRCTSQEGADRG